MDRASRPGRVHAASVSFLITIGLAPVPAGAGPEAGTFHFGWAEVDITPGKPVAISGQYGTRISGDVHDRIGATALAIETEDGGESLDQAVFVSCDVVAVRRLVVDRMRERVGPQVPDLDARKVFVSTTHTHTAPSLTDTEETDLHPYDFAGSWAYRIPEDRTDVMRPSAYVDFLVSRLGEVVVAAWKARKPGGLSTALGHAVVAHNRRAVYRDGTARMYGDTSDPNFSHIEGTSDHSIDMLFLWREERLEGMAITVYCPSQEVEGERYLSADFWYDTRKLLREKHHPDLYVLSLCGASGDQSPHVLWNKAAERARLERAGRSARDDIARRILQAVDHEMDASRRHIRTKLPFQHRVETVPLPVWKVSDGRFSAAQAVVEAGKDWKTLSSPDYINWRVSRTLMARYELQKRDPYYQAELHFLRLGDLAVATNPFELYVDYGLRIKSQSPAVQTMVVQLTGDGAAYLPTRRAVSAGGYSARIVDGVVGPEGGDVLVDRTSKALRELWAGE